MMAFIKCPPAIAQGSEINGLTRKDVARMRRAYLTEFGTLRPGCGEEVITAKRKPGRPRKERVTIDVRCPIERIWASKLIGHAMNHIPKTLKQRRWDYILDAFSFEKVLAEIEKTKPQNFDGVVKHFHDLIEAIEGGRNVE